MHVKELMTRNCETVKRDATLFDTAKKMKQHDCGAMPVADNGKWIGLLTDRDIVVRGLADGHDPKHTKVGDIMTKELTHCYEDQPLEEAAELMRKKKIRRLVVFNRQDKPVGMLSLGDLAENFANEKVGELVEAVSK